MYGLISFCAVLFRTAPHRVFSLHAQGDAAIAKVLDIFETCRRDAQGRVINRHAITDLEFCDPQDLKRMDAMGVIAEIYPQIQSIADREGKLAMISEKIGMERDRYYWNRRKMADSGCTTSSLAVTAAAPPLARSP